MRSFQKAILIFAVFSLCGQESISQTTDRLIFESNKEWKSSRWYVIGKWINSQQIEWIDGKKTNVSWEGQNCSRSPYIPRFESRSNTADDLEILRSGPWIAVEINPVLVQENFELKVRHPRDNTYCEAKLLLSISLSGKGADLRPVLVLQPTGSRYFGKRIDVSILNFMEKADIQLDLLLAYWYIHLPNRQATGAASALHLLPVAITRLEWLATENAKWGTHLFLEQSSASWRGQAQQKLIMSNWGLGGFYQEFFHIGQGLQLRSYLEYSQFRADDGTIINSVAQRNIEAHFFNLGLLTQYYFKDRWSVGMEGKFGYPNRMAGQGVSQSHYAGFFKINYRLSPTLTFLYQAGYRAYKTSETNPESIYSSSLGLRLDL